MLVKDGLVYISSFSSGAILEDEFKARNTRKQSVAAIDAVKSFISADEAYLAISPDDYSTTEAALGINTPYAFVEERGDETYVEPVIDDDMLRHLANSEGLLVVEDEIWLIQRNYILMAPYEEYSTGLAFPHGSDNIRKEVIKREKVELPNEIEKANIGRCRDEYGTRRRVTGEIEVRNSIFNGATRRVIVRTKHFLRPAFPRVWFGTEADRLGHRGSIARLGLNAGFSTIGSINGDIGGEEFDFFLQNFPSELATSDGPIEIEPFFGGFNHRADDDDDVGNNCLSVPTRSS